MSSEVRREPRKLLFSRIPADVRSGKESSCDPLQISIGPYHHHDTSCKERQGDKDHCFQRVCCRYGKQYSDFEKALADMPDDPMNEYHDVHWSVKWRLFTSRAGSSMMMIYDACYLLEIMREACVHEAARDSTDVHVFNSKDMDIYRHDLLLYENQIPLSVLQCVASVQDPEKQSEEIYEYLIDLILGFFGLRQFSGSYPKCWHILDVYRHGLLRCIEAPGDWALEFNIPSATELKEVKVRIRPSRTSSPMDISFNWRTLRLPQVKLCDVTKSNFHNLVWFEQLGLCESKLFSAYVYFMSSLLKDPADSFHLRDLEIITTSWTDVEVAEMFRGLCQNSEFNPKKDMTCKLLLVVQGIDNWLNQWDDFKELYKNTVEWRKELFQNYLRSPFTIIALLGGFVFFSLAAIQTIYTVLSYSKRK